MKKVMGLFMVVVLVLSVAPALILANNDDSHGDDDYGNGREYSDDDYEKNQERERVRDETHVLTDETGEEARVRVRVERDVEETGGAERITIRQRFTYENGTEIEREMRIITEQNRQRLSYEGDLGTDSDDAEVEIDEDLEIEDAVRGNMTVIRARLSNGNFSEIDILPDRARELVRERLRIHNTTNVSIELRERIHRNVPEVVYNVETNENGRFLGIFKLSMKSSAEVDAETGEIVQTRRPWWAFLVTKDNSE